MADALCGPSNALQNFKQHVQVDRSLQQDRLSGPRAPSQSFRNYDPRAGSLDAEFHAFENAPALPFQEPFIGNNFVAQPHLQPPAPSNWASDFQRLSISNQPLPAQQFREYAPLIKSTNRGWHSDFMKQEQQQQQGLHTTTSKGKEALYGQQNALVYSPQLSHQTGFAPISSFGAQFDTIQPATQQHDQFASADWTQAFEDAFQDVSQEMEQAQEIGNVQDPLTVPQDAGQYEEKLESISRPEQIRIGSDAIEYTEVKDRSMEQEQQDASSLARVAGELLHNVQHDSSSKFQNSQFLDLMRKIRDREVEVRNNEFEKVGTSINDGVPQIPQNTTLTDQEIRNIPNPHQDQDTFTFPNMDTVYAPRKEDGVDYTFDSDQFPSQPRTQISDLHPGGRLYPEQSPPSTYAQMSGAVPATATLRDSGDTGKGYQRHSA